MINAIVGTLAEVRMEESIAVVRAGGVEWALIVSGLTASRLAALRGEQRENVRVLAVLSHHEDSMLLYGFWDEAERDAFNQLQNVAGIGPRAALKILSGITVENLIRALDRQDVKALASVPGVGPKTASKIILQLRDKLVLPEEGEGPAAGGKQAAKWHALVDGLVDMGWDRRTAAEAVEKIASENAEKLAGMSQRDQESFIFARALTYLG